MIQLIKYKELMVMHQNKHMDHYPTERQQLLDEQAYLKVLMTWSKDKTLQSKPKCKMSKIKLNQIEFESWPLWIFNMVQSELDSTNATFICSWETISIAKQKALNSVCKTDLIFQKHAPLDKLHPSIIPHHKTTFSKLKITNIACIRV